MLWNGLRLTLKRWTDSRFELTASDLAGRALWRLAVDGRLGRLDAGRDGRRCRLDPTESIDLPRLRLPLEAESLPALLLGRLPEVAASARGADAETVRDRYDRSWELEHSAGALVGWRLSSNRGAPELVWRREDDRFRLECRERELVVDWQEKARSELRSPAPALELEAELPDCRELDLS